ncbi:MAG: DinB/UmuC family translesion DNA polymerase [Gemmatimonadaceae bacterium]
MSFVCLSTPRWRTDAASAAELAPALLACVPRVVTDARGLVWADARGLDARAVAGELLELVRSRGIEDVRVSVASTAIAAEIAVIAPCPEGTRPEGARGLRSADLLVVDPGADAEFIALHSIDLLSPSPKLLPLLDGTGIATCGDLAVLDCESVEVRFGVEGVRLWQLARADDRRPIFTEVPRELPHASLDWTDYTLTDPERLVFIINALAERVTTSLEECGESAREIALVFTLANRGPSVHRVRFTRPTSSRKTWMRQLRALLDGVTLGDAVTGVLLRVDAIAAKRSPQGDLFDRGFASAGATEQTLAQLIDDHGEILLTPSRTQHALLERRTRWVAESPSTLIERGGSEVGAGRALALPHLTLQLLPHPEPITVITNGRRDHRVPVRYQDGARWHHLVDVAGPDRVSGGHWEETYAREYFRGVREDGVMVWVYRDAVGERWFLHGWWD